MMRRVMVSFHVLKYVGGTPALLQRTWDEIEANSWKVVPGAYILKKFISIEFENEAVLTQWLNARGIYAPKFATTQYLQSIENEQGETEWINVSIHELKGQRAKSEGSKFEICHDFGIDRGKIPCMASPKSTALRSVPKPKRASASNWQAVAKLKGAKELSFTEWRKHFQSIGYSNAKAKKLASEKIKNG